MAKLIFFYDNKWDGVSDIVAVDSEHVNFPAELTQHRDFNHPWLSNYGAGSGWGRFYIDSSNNKLYFKDNGATARTATITPGGYNADELIAEIETQMEAQTTDTFTNEYLESGSNANKFKITNDIGSFELTCTNTTNAIWVTIGFSTAADKTGADNYTADYIRIHTQERLKVDLGSAMSIDAFICRGHNIQSGASFKKIQGNATDSWGSPTVNENLSQNTKLIGKILSSAQSLQWWQAYYVDRDNPDTYLKQGRIFLGPGFEPATNFLNQPHSKEPQDPSIIKESEAGQESSIQLPHFDTWTYIFRVIGSSEVSNFKTMFDTVGKSLPLFIAEDPDNFPEDCYYCRFVDYSWSAIVKANDYWELNITVKELI